jgi:hypothetical protein
MRSDDLRRKIRSSSAQTTSEFAGVFMIFFLVIFFPLLDMAAMGALWGTGMLLNSETARQVSFVANRGITGAAEKTAVSDPVTERKTRADALTAAWAGTGFCQFLKMDTKSINHTITVSTVGTGSNPDEYVHVKTNLVANPFLNIPFPVEVPGLNKSMTFTYAQERLIEQ